MLKRFIYSLLLITSYLQAEDLLIEYAHNPLGWPAFHYALEMRRPDIAKEILELYPEQAKEHTPALKLMAFHLGNNADQDYDYFTGNYESGISALELAVRYGDKELVKKLIDLGANADEYRLEWLVEVAPYWEPRGKPWVYERVKFPSTKEWVARSILYWALENNSEDVAILLLDNGAKLTPCFASHHQFRLDHPIDVVKHAFEVARDTPLLKKLIEHQASRPVPDEVVKLYRASWPPLHYALESNDIEGFKQLLSYGADPFYQQNASCDLFTMAFEHTDESFLYALIDYIPIEEAIRRQNIPLLTKLLSMYEPNSNHLELAIERGCLEVVHLLSEFGCYHPTAMSLAIQHHSMPIFSFLLENGSVDERAAFVAIEQNELEMLCKLLKAYPATDEQIKELKKCAITHKRSEILSFLGSL